MGNVLSGDEKFSQLFSPYDKKQRGIVWIDEQFGYRPANKSQKKAFDQGRTLYYDESKGRITRQRSQSLGAIIGDLYGYEEDLGGSYQGLSSDHTRRFSRSFLPRIKLTKDMPIKDDIQYSSNLDMYKCSQGRYMTSTPTTSYREQLIFRDKEVSDRSLSRTRSYEENNFHCEIMEKPEENYFTKNFDECMKRLEIIEKEQEVMEKDGGRTKNVYNYKKPVKRQMTPPNADDFLVLPPVKEIIEETGKRVTDKEEEESHPCVEKFTQNENNTDQEKAQPGKENLDFEVPEEEKSSLFGPCRNDTIKLTRGWYSNLRKQFENENEDSRAKETSCRVTGATLKGSSVSTQTSNDEGKEMRHYFSRLVRSNKSLIDEELPDPDKVQNIRAMFQESLNSTLQKNFNGRFGGSLQNINVKPTEEQFTRPKSAQGNRNDFIAEFRKINQNCSVPSNETGIYVTKQSLLKGNTKGLINNTNIQCPGAKSRVIDPQGGKIGNKKFLQTKWTDTTSLSSGVSSDLSSYDTDAECYSREEIEENTTDEEVQDEDDDKHYIQNEALEKIRSFGTSVTYFGGQMITCSVGPLLSPTTQAILEEIGEKYPDRKNFTRTFEEFYRKYTENNEPRIKKIGRTRSFGQSDVFQKPNILRNMEIDMYKNDLETEIGIRKPTGKGQNTLKQKLVKSSSVGSRFELFEQEVVDKLNEILEAAVDMTAPENRANEGTEACETETMKVQGAASSEMEDNVQGEESIPYEELRSKGNKREEKVETSEMASNESLPQSRSNELLFGYEKDLLKKERKPDMDFEEFEVCETVEEKIEKLEENPQSYRLTIQVNQDAGEEVEALEEIIINDQEPLDSLEIYLKTRKSEGKPKELPVENNSDGKSEDTEKAPTHTEHIHANLQKCCHTKPGFLDMQPMSALENHSNVKPYVISKWPIETTVMIDIQKNEKNTPKLVTTGKSMVKTKTRSFKK